MSDIKPRVQRGLVTRPVGAVAVALLASVGIYFLWVDQPTPALEIVENGKKLAQVGRMDEAVAQWQQAVASDPNCAPAWAELGNYYRLTGDADAAIEPYRHLVDLSPDMPGVFGFLIGSVVHAQHPENAYNQALKDIAKRPNDLAALTISASYLSARDEQRMQLVYLRRLAQLRPQDADALTNLARTLVNTHQYEEALPVLERLIALAPESPAGYDLRGQALLKGVGSSQALAQAESDFLKTLQLKSPSLFPHLNLGRVYIRLGKPVLAIEQLQAAADLLPYRPDVYYELARAYTMARQPKQAAEAQARFVELRQNDDRERALTKRLGAYPDNFAIHLELARLLMQKGDMENAKPHLDQALALRPKDVGARQTARQFVAMTGGAEKRH